MSIYLSLAFKEYDPTMILFIYDNAIHAETFLKYKDNYIDFVISYNKAR